jgi:hypothetical protein
MHLMTRTPHRAVSLARRGDRAIAADHELHGDLLEDGMGLGLVRSKLYFAGSRGVLLNEFGGDDFWSLLETCTGGAVPVRPAQVLSSTIGRPDPGLPPAGGSR